MWAIMELGWWQYMMTIKYIYINKDSDKVWTLKHFVSRAELSTKKQHMPCSAFELPVFWCQAAECLKFLCVRASVSQNIGLLANSETPCFGSGRARGEVSDAADVSEQRSPLHPRALQWPESHQDCVSASPFNLLCRRCNLYCYGCVKSRHCSVTASLCVELHFGEVQQHQYLVSPSLWQSTQHIDLLKSPLRGVAGASQGAVLCPGRTASDPVCKQPETSTGSTAWRKCWVQLFAG